MTSRRAPAAMALLAAALAAATHAWGPPGGDQAAHLYLTRLWSDHGWLVWDNLWYAGRYAQVNYSLLYYPLAALVGPVAVSAAGGGAAAGAFAWLTRRRWPWAGDAPGWVFAALIPLPVIAGTYPFLLALAFALWALVAMSARRAAAAVACAVGAWLASPLALAFLLLAGAAAVVARPGRLRTRGGIVAGAGMAMVLIAQLVAMRAFPSPDARYPFDPKDAAAILLFCAAGLVLTWGVSRSRDLTAFFGVYAAAALATLVVPTGLGGNMVRVTLVAGVPLLLVAASARGTGRAYALAAPAVAAALAWQVTPAVTGAPPAWRAHASDAAYWRPVDAFLAEHGDPAYRVHVVATTDNWEAYYVPRDGRALTRGWFRQDDFPVNAPLYDDPLTADAYAAWLHDVGVRYVFVPDDPKDYTGAAEAALLDGGGVLRARKALPGFRVFEVPDAQPIASPTGARVVEVTPGRLVVRVTRPGAYRLRVRYSPYLRVPLGACLAPRAPWGATLTVARPGDVAITFAPTWGTAWRVLTGRTATCPRGPVA